MMDTLAHVVRGAEKKGATDAEAFYFKRNELQVRAENKQVKIGEWKSDAGIGMRLAVKRDGGFSQGFAYSTDFSKAGLDKAVGHAFNVGSARKPDRFFKGFCERDTFQSVEGIYDKRIPELPPEQAIDLVNGQIEAALIDSRVHTVKGLTFLLTTEIAVANSHGVSGEFETTGFSSGIYVLAKEGDSQGVWSDDYVSCRYTEDEPTKMVEGITKSAVQQLHAKPIEAGKMDLVMTPDALAELLIYTFILEARADRVQKSQSPLAGKLGQPIGSEVLTVLNDGLAPEAMGSRVFDDEGVPTRRTTLIEKGVLKGFLYDTYTARRDSVQSTGNALRYALLQLVPKYKLEPLVGPTNVVVQPGKTSREGLIREVKNGIFTKSFIGAHTSNSESGAFSVMPYCAFKVEDGEIKYPIKEAMIGGDILTLLKNVEIVANDVKQVLFYEAALLRDSALIAPSVLVRNVSVSG